MASTSGIRANGLDCDEYTRQPILKDMAGHSVQNTKMETILDADDRQDIVMGTENEPNEFGWVIDERQEKAAAAVSDAAKKTLRALETCDMDH